MSDKQENYIENEVLQLDAIKTFIKNNGYWVYDYINAEVLKDMGVMNDSYFIQIIEEIFVRNAGELKQSNRLSIALLPYSILTLINGSGNMTYTSLRMDTLNFATINKEASVYYNYLRFSLDDIFFSKDCLGLELMQSKIGGMPIDGDIVKFAKAIPLKPLGLSQYIDDNKAYEKIFAMCDGDIRARYDKEAAEKFLSSKKCYLKITNALNELF